MKYDDLEKTKDLFDIPEDVPTPIENIEMEGASKETLTDEFTLGLRDTEDMELLKARKENKKNKKEKRSLKEWFTSLSKTKKVFLILGIILLIVIIALIIFFGIKNNKKKPVEEEKPEEPVVIIEKENYIYKNGILSLLDNENNEIGTYTCNNKEETLCFVANYNNEDNFDTPKNVYEDGSLVERRSAIYENNYVFIYDNKDANNGVITLYNIKEEKTEGTYAFVKGFNNTNFVILKDTNGKYGGVEFTTEEIKERFAFTYDYLGMQDSESKIVAKASNKYYIATREGKLETKGLAYEIKSYNNKYIAVDNDGYYIYNYSSSLALDDSYDYARLLDDYIVLVSDKKIYIKDYNDNKYNEVGISLSNTDYNVTNIFDKDKKLIETKKSFNVEIEDEQMNITTYKDTKESRTSLSLKEGKLSANLKYMNYFDGKLYFYNDEEEKTLIGTYTCSNKNLVESDTKTLSNCKVASDSFYSKNETEEDNSANVGWIPVYNEQFVFINDSISDSNATIILYDLKNNKTLSKYESVDSGAYTKEVTITHVSDATTYIMAKNKSNKYGVIKIEGDSVKSAIPFNYTLMEKLKDYYMAKESSETYVLLDNTGKEISSKYGNKIVNYGYDYLLVKDSNNKYYVYDFKGNKIDETGYLSITLYKEYYVVITSDYKLDIRQYSNSNYGLKEPISVGASIPSYKVEATSIGYTITINSNETKIAYDDLK